MAFFKVSTAAEAVSESTGGKFIGTSGIYPVTIKFVSVQTNDHNARSLNFNIEYEGNPQTFYGLKLDNNNGTENFEAKIFNKLCIINEVDVVSDPVIESHKIGRDQTPTDLAVLTDFSDMDVYMRVVLEYSLYNGELKSKKLIRGFYRASDKATAEEIVNETTPGVKYEKDLPLSEAIVYKDNLTAEKVAELQSSKSAGAQAPANTATVAPVKKNLFA